MSLYHRNSVFLTIWKKGRCRPVLSSFLLCDTCNYISRYNRLTSHGRYQPSYWFIIVVCRYRCISISTCDLVAVHSSDAPPPIGNKISAFVSHSLQGQRNIHRRLFKLTLRYQLTIAAGKPGKHPGSFIYGFFAASSISSGYWMPGMEVSVSVIPSILWLESTQPPVYANSTWQGYKYTISRLYLAIKR